MEVSQQDLFSWSIYDSPLLCGLWAQVAFRVCPVGGRGGVGWREKNDFMGALQETANSTDFAHSTSTPQPGAKGGTCQEARVEAELANAKERIKGNPVVFGRFTRKEIAEQAQKFGAENQV